MPLLAPGQKSEHRTVTSASRERTPKGAFDRRLNCCVQNNLCTNESELRDNLLSVRIGHATCSKSKNQLLPPFLLLLCGLVFPLPIVICAPLLALQYSSHSVLVLYTHSLPVLCTRTVNNHTRAFNPCWRRSGAGTTEGQRWRTQCTHCQHSFIHILNSSATLTDARAHSNYPRPTLTHIGANPQIHYLGTPLSKFLNHSLNSHSI